ncbi:hypothetical protein GWN42_10175 [candidate division KSB1 bacterium]|nr:hypothetical protein [candidate division KSB1 bacterium]
MDLFDPICFNLPILSRFCIGARIDITTLTHLLGGVFLVFLFHKISNLILNEQRSVLIAGIGSSVGYLLGEEMAQGSCSVQGFDIIDLLAGLMGVALYVGLNRKRLEKP